MRESNRVALRECPDFHDPQSIRSLAVAAAFSFPWAPLIDGWAAGLLAAPATGPVRPPTHDATLTGDSLAAALTALTKAYPKKHGPADALWREKLPRKKSPPATAPALAGA